MAADSPSAWIPLTCLLSSLGVNVLIQMLLCRIFRGRHFMRTVGAGFLAGALWLTASSLAALALAPSPKSAWMIPANLFIYACLGYCYANFVNLGQASIRIRLFEEIRRHSDGVPLSQITKTYDDSSLLTTRLERLTESADLVLRNSVYQVGRKRFLIIGSVIITLKRFVLCRESEFNASIRR